MNYISTKEAADRWGLTERRVRSLCQEGCIPNVSRSGRTWLIPENAVRPDVRKLHHKETIERLDLFLNPNFCSNNTYASFSDEEKTICAATDYYLRGQYEIAEKMLTELLDGSSTDNYRLIAYHTLYLCYVNSKKDCLILSETIQKMQELLTANKDFIYAQMYNKLVFTRAIGIQEVLELPREYHPVFFSALIELDVFSSLSGEKEFNAPYAEFLCASLSKDTNPCILLFMHIVLCTYYNLVNNMDAYRIHLDKALEIALPRKWYGPFASYSYTHSWIEIKAVDEEAFHKINELSNIVINNYISNGFFNDALYGIEKPSATKLRVAIMLAKGMTNPQIAQALGLTLYKVKYYVKQTYIHTHTNTKEELAEFIKLHMKAF